MLMEELEAQCMNVSNFVDTEIVDGDPRELSTFDASTLYVWAVPGTPELRAKSEPPGASTQIHLLRGRFGERDAVAGSVPELAKKLGVDLPAPQLN